jgi:hypothetical protein
VAEQKFNQYWVLHKICKCIPCEFVHHTVPDFPLLWIQTDCFRARDTTGIRLHTLINDFTLYFFKYILYQNMFEIEVTDPNYVIVFCTISRY